MIEFEHVDDTIFPINLREIVDSGDFSAISTSLASRLIENPYISMGDFFTGISYGDLLTLLHFSEIVTEKPDHDGYETACMELELLCDLLALAEGTSTTNEPIRMRNFRYLITIITMVEMERKEILTVNWENVSFGSELDDAEICSLN